MAQERGFAVVLPELQYSRQCSSEISLHNLSPRFVDVEVIGHKSTGALVGLIDRPVNRMRLRPTERARMRLDVEDDVAWAEVVEIIPSPRLRPVLAIGGKTECLDGNELLTAGREIAAVTADPGFSTGHESALLNGMVLLLINASGQRMTGQPATRRATRCRMDTAR